MKENEQTEEPEKTEEEPVENYDDIDLNNLGELTRAEAPFKYEGVDYLLLEIAGNEREKYNDRLFSEFIQEQPDGKSKVVKHEGLTLLLLSGLVVDAKNRKPVSDEKLKDWGNSALVKLYRAARKLGGLDSKSKKDAAKNS